MWKQNGTFVQQISSFTFVVLTQKLPFTVKIDALLIVCSFLLWDQSSKVWFKVKIPMIVQHYLYAGKKNKSGSNAMKRVGGF